MSDLAMIIFCDIDGVLCLTGRRMDARLVANLNRIVEAAPKPCGIVFNTAWNINTLEKMAHFLDEAGFKHPEVLLGRTDECGGGGNPIRRYLIANDLVGTPYLILDDSTHDMLACWSRLAHCRSQTGLTDDVVEKAIAIMRRPITSEYAECACACHSIKEHSEQIQQAGWLTDHQRQEYLHENFKLMQALNADTDFLHSALLIR